MSNDKTIVVTIHSMYGPPSPAKMVLGEADAVKAVEEIFPQLSESARQHLRARLDGRASATMLPPGAFWVTHQHFMAAAKGSAQLSGYMVMAMHTSRLFHSLTLGSGSPYTDRMSSRDLLAHVDELLSIRRSGMGSITQAAIMRLTERVRSEDASAASKE